MPFHWVSNQDCTDMDFATSDLFLLMFGNFYFQVNVMDY